MRLREYAWSFLTFEWLVGIYVPIQNKKNRFAGVLFVIIFIAIGAQGVFFWRWNEHDNLRIQMDVEYNNLRTQHEIEYNMERTQTLRKIRERAYKDSEDFRSDRREWKLMIDSVRNHERKRDILQTPKGH